MDDIKERYISMCLISDNYDYEELCEMTTIELRDLAGKLCPKVIKQHPIDSEAIYIVLPKKTA